MKLNSCDSPTEPELEKGFLSEKSCQLSTSTNSSRPSKRLGGIIGGLLLLVILVLFNLNFSLSSFILPSYNSQSKFTSSILNFVSTSGLNIHRHGPPSTPSEPRNNFHWKPCEGVQDKRFKCGYLDVPLDYTNPSDDRKVRLATTLFQANENKSKHTVVTNPGGPGGSGSESAFFRGPYIGNLTNDEFDVLGFDPRGVNLTDPSISCFPHDAYRDRFSLLTTQYRETSSSYPLSHLQIADSFNEAMMSSCLSKYKDIPRFLSTAFVARDVDEIRKALGEELLYGYMVSYGTGIGQTYSQMFPNHVGRMILDGLEFVKDHRELGGFGWTSLDNVTDAYRDGFLGECVRAGSQNCALAMDTDGEVSDLKALEERMENLFQSLLARPIPAWTEELGAGIITYESLIQIIYASLYNGYTWPKTAKLVSDLEKGNASLALEAMSWTFDPRKTEKNQKPSSEELTMMVVCGDSYDAEPKPIEFWAQMQAEMTKKSFISGNDRLFNVLPCRHFKWDVAEVYRGDFNHSLTTPLLLFGETYDPATPLRNGRRLAEALGQENARLVVHNGYGHATRDVSKCSEDIKRSFLVNGTLPEKGVETNCYADEKSYPKDGHKEEVFSHSEWLEAVRRVGKW